MEKSIVITGTPANVAKFIMKNYEHEDLWVVGDVVCQNLLLHGLKPRVCIFDERTLRCKHRPMDTGLFNVLICVYNPRGTISEEALRALENISMNRLLGTVGIRVYGEEDLLAIASIIVAPIGSIVAYGIPHLGVALIPVTEHNKLRAQHLLSSFIVRASKDLHGPRSAHVFEI